jgi:hypothetical protein
VRGRLHLGRIPPDPALLPLSGPSAPHGAGRTDSVGTCQLIINIATTIAEGSRT